MNRQYNKEVERTSFWLEIASLLATFERLVPKQSHLTAKDKKALKYIQRVLSESYKLAGKQRSYHSRQLERIKRDYLNEC